MQALSKLTETRPDVVNMLLADKRSVNTKRAYRKDLCDFFGCDPDPATVQAFLASDTAAIAMRLAEYKNGMLSKGLSEATVNRRLSAVKSLINYARRLGYCNVNPAGLVDSEKAQPYRDTTGISADEMKRLLAAPDTSTVKGKRDYAVLRILADNALRRSEVCKLDITDFWPHERKLDVLGKGRGTQKERLTLNEKTTAAILDYLHTTGRAAGNGPLFVNCDRRGTGTRLTTDGLYYLIRDYAKEAGIDRPLSPHKLRHSAITAVLDRTNGNVRAAQRLSRHSKLDTLTVYDDNRTDMQGAMTELLGELW